MPLENGLPQPTDKQIEEMFLRIEAAGDAGVHYRFMPRDDKRKVDVLFRRGVVEFDNDGRVFVRQGVRFTTNCDSYAELLEAFLSRDKLRAAAVITVLAAGLTAACYAMICPMLEMHGIERRDYVGGE